MIISFANEKLRAECNAHDLLRKRYGEELARVLRQRLDELFNAQSLAEMRSMPHVSLSGPLPDDPALYLELANGHRLALPPHPPGKHGHGEMDWKKIDSILILGLSR